MALCVSLCAGCWQAGPGKGSGGRNVKDTGFGYLMLSGRRNWACQRAVHGLMHGAAKGQAYPWPEDTGKIAKEKPAGVFKSLEFAGRFH